MSAEWISLNLDLGLANIINIINIFNSHYKLVKTYHGNFDPQYRNDGLPYAELSKSYKSHGSYKIYPTIDDSKSLKSRLTNNDNIQYIGWYAKIAK